MDDLSHFPIVIAGAGLAGSAAAIVLSRAGWRVALLERDAFPRDKLCGEFLSGESVALLDRIGCLSQIRAFDPPVFTHVCFISPTGKRLQVELPKPSLGFSRRRLDQLLYENACKYGAHGVTECQVRNIRPRSDHGLPAVDTVLADGSGHTFSANLVIAAYGRRSLPDRGLNRKFLHHLDSSMGIKLHHRVVSGAEGERAFAELSTLTEVYGIDGGYCGVSMVEGGHINVCMLLRRRTFAKVGSTDWAELTKFLCAANPALGRRLKTLVPLDEQTQTVSQMPFGQKEQAINGVVFAGDAAGMIAPLCGGGQAMALESGVMLADLVNRRYPDPGAVADRGEAMCPGAEWQAQWRRKYARRMVIGRVLQGALFSPAGANIAMSFLKASPFPITGVLARATRSE